MKDPFFLLMLTAASLGFLHTAVGVDHSVPFVALSRARGWSLRRTLWITCVCGSGHVLSSVLIAAVGLGMGIAGSKLQGIEETRGSLAAWLLVGFGLAYSVIAYWRHKHSPVFEDERAFSMGRVVPSLFVLFVLGPCEALLPLLTASGMTLSLAESCWVATVFGLSTLGTMISLVALGLTGLHRFERWSLWDKLRPHAHLIAGLTLAASGLGIQVLGI